MGKSRAISISHYKDGGECICFDSGILGRGRIHHGFGCDNLQSHLKYVERKARGLRKKEEGYK